MRKKLSTFNFQLRARPAKGRGGFTLVEVLVSISIFMVAIVSMVVVSAQSITNSGHAKNQLTASYLAQEGIEIVRNARDNAVNVSPTGWNDFLNDSNNVVVKCEGPYGCEIDPLEVFFHGITDNNAVTTCTALCNNRLLYNDTASFYTYATSGNPTTTLFTRTVHVDTSRDTTREIQITTTVSWQEGSTTQHVSMTEDLFNWRLAPQ